MLNVIQLMGEVNKVWTSAMRGTVAQWQAGADVWAASQTIAKRIARLQERSVAFAQDSMQKNVAYVQDLSRARQPAELLQLGQAFAWQQIDTTRRQMASVAAIVAGQESEAAQPEAAQPNDAGGVGRERNTSSKQHREATRPPQDSATGPKAKYAAATNRQAAKTAKTEPKAPTRPKDTAPRKRKSAPQVSKVKAKISRRSKAAGPAQTGSTNRGRKTTKATAKRR